MLKQSNAEFLGGSAAKELRGDAFNVGVTRDWLSSFWGAGEAAIVDKIGVVFGANQFLHAINVNDKVAAGVEINGTVREFLIEGCCSV